MITLPGFPTLLMPAIWQTTERMYKTCSKSVVSTSLLYFIAKSIDIDGHWWYSTTYHKKARWRGVIYIICDYLCCWIRRPTPLERCLIWWCGWAPWTTTCASIGCTGEFEQATWIEDGQRSVKSSVCMTGIYQLFQFVLLVEQENSQAFGFVDLNKGPLSPKTLVWYWILHKLIEL